MNQTPQKTALSLSLVLALVCGANPILRQVYDAQQPAFRTVAGFGRTQRQNDRALVLALTGGEFFQEEAAPACKIPTPEASYALKDFPAQDGYFELYACPWFNGPAPYPLAEILAGGQAVCRLTLTSTELLVEVQGQTAKLNTANWAARHYKHIQLVWKNGETSVFLERKKTATLNAIPENADQLKLFPAFQGLVDEVTVGSGWPLTIDPQPDGDLTHFPRIAPDKTPLLKEQWTAKDLGIEQMPDANGLRFLWEGAQKQLGAAAQCLTEWNVRPGTYLRGDFAWTKENWSHGAQFSLHLHFLDEGGQILKRMSIDGRNIEKYIFPMMLSEFCTESAIGVPMEYFNYYQVPEKAVRLRVALSAFGNSFTLTLRNIAFRYIDAEKTPWFREPYDEQLVHPTAHLTNAEVDEILARRERAVPELRREGDRIELYLNGKRTPVKILAQPMAGDYKWMTGFRQAGFPFFLSTVTVGLRPDYTEAEQLWREDDTIDVGVLDRAVRRILSRVPDAYVFLCLSITPSRSWLEANREELMVNQTGEYAVIRDYGVRGLYSKHFPDQSGSSWYPSTASLKYRQKMAEVLHRAFTEFERHDASKAVVGVYVTGGDDGQFRFPPFPDYSRPALASWRSFLKEQGRPDADAAVMPNPEELNRPPFPPYGNSTMCDYQMWSTKVSYELRQFMYRTVKDAFPRALVGGYENAMGLTGQPGFGRYKISEFLHSPTPDFLISLPGYNRYRDDCDHPSGMKAYNGSMVLHNKLMIGEMDIRNPEMGPLGINNRSRNWQATHNATTFRNFLALYASYCASWGGGFHAYIMQPLWYNTPRALEAWGRAAAIVSQAKGQPLNESRIAVFIDEHSSYYHATRDIPAFHTRIHYRESTEYALWRSGIRCDYYLPGDALHPDFQAPKILFFADAGTMTPAQADAIRKRWGNSGRLIIWSGHAGYLPAGDAKAVQQITGFKVRPEAKAAQLPLTQGSTLLWEPAFYATNFPVPAWVVEDTEATPLARYYGTSQVGLAEKHYPTHREIYLGQPGSFSPELTRKLARSVGIEPVQDRNDLCVLGGGLMEIGAMTGSGKRKLRLPPGAKSMVCLTSQEAHAIPGGVELFLPYKDCAVFRVEY